MQRVRLVIALFVPLLLATCGDTARLPPGADFGPKPTLPPPDQSLIPTVEVAKAVGWPRGAKPIAAAGLAVNSLATGLHHPRWLYVLPNGDVLVAETNAPSGGEGEAGIKGWITGLVMSRA